MGTDQGANVKKKEGERASFTKILIEVSTMASAQRCRIIIALNHRDCINVSVIVQGLQTMRKQNVSRS